MSNEAKRLAFNDAIEHGLVRITFDPSHKDATVPEHLRAQTHVVFQYGYGLVVPIPDLLVTEHGVSATLSFNRRPAYTFVPWSAVFALTDESGHVETWGSDAPRAFIEMAVDAIAAHPARGLLHLVKGGKPS